MIAFSLFACGVLWIVPSISHIVLAVVCLGLSADCYWLFLYSYRDVIEKRTIGIFAVWAVGLLFAGVFLLFPLAAAGAVLGTLGVIAMLATRRRQFRALKLHAVVLITAAAFASGMIQYASQCLVGQMPQAPQWSVILVSACAVIVCAVSQEDPDADLTARVAPFATIFVAACAVAALLIHALIGLFALASTASAFHIAVLRTASLCALAITLAFGGKRLRRATMATMAYCVVAFVTAKLLFEDLRHGNLAFIAASICLVALTFILVPRIAGRARHQAGFPQ
jgi:hypothetical protein